MTSLEKDKVSRNRIVSEMNMNFFVEAGAGSGKTTMLVNRMVAMVEAGIDISRISAITFTKAAAAEFYDRFQKLLIERSKSEDIPESRTGSGPLNGDDEVGSGCAGFVPLSGNDDAGSGCAGPGTMSVNDETGGYTIPGRLPAPTAQTRRRCEQALENIDLCFMGTIDSFCGMILSEHPYEAQIPSDARIAKDEEVQSLYQQQYVRICAGEYGEELASLAATFRALYWNAEEVFLIGISFFMNHRNAAFHYNTSVQVDIDKDFRAQRNEMFTAVRCLMDHPELKYSGNKDSREAWEKISDIYKNLNRPWSSNFAGVRNAIKTLANIRLIPQALDRYGISLGTVFAPGGARKQWLQFTGTEQGGICQKLQNLQYNASMLFLDKCTPIMEKALKEKGYMTFFDCLLYLRNMLRKDAQSEGKLIRYIYERHSYFLIDEFQDTNPMQAEIFFYLSSEKPVPQWSACVPRPGSLFIVGDPKQSIYRFRSADVTSFLKVKRLFEKNGGAILSLSRNFRSTRMLCGYFNRVFSQMLPEETSDQSRFEDIPLPEASDGEFQGIFTYKAYVGKAEEDHPDQTDPIQIGKLIQTLVGNDQYKITTGTEKVPRPVKYGDFMVITYNKNNLGNIMARLDELDIPARVEGAVPFSENEALCEITRIYAALADTDDKAALYGALTGSILGYTKEDLLGFRACGGKLSIKTTQELSDEAVQGLTPATTTSREPSAATAQELTAAAVQKLTATTEQELSACAVQRPDGGSRTEAVSEDGKESPDIAAAGKVADTINRLHDLWNTTRRMSPVAMFSKIMDEFRIYRIVEAKNLEVLCYSLELLRDAEKTGDIVSIKDGRAFLEKLCAGESDIERCLSLTDNKDCVHMANLHKVKGLEAPIVILAAAGPANISASSRFLHGDSGSEGYVFSVDSKRESSRQSSFSYFKTEEFGDEADAEKAALKAEEQRLIYVAATRARNVLILCDSIYKKWGKEVASTRWKPLMEEGIPDFFSAVQPGLCSVK